MMKTKLLTEWIGLAGASVAFVAGYIYIIRPWTRFWGSTNREVKRALPGDDIVPKPRYMTTRAVSIQAPAAEVWPWLIQMGQDRGGLYSYDWLENAIGGDIHSTNQIISASRVRRRRPPDFCPELRFRIGGAPQRAGTCAGPFSSILWMLGTHD